jgi:hypothetical protein
MRAAFPSPIDLNTLLAKPIPQRRQRTIRHEEIVLVRRITVEIAYLSEGDLPRCGSPDRTP